MIILRFKETNDDTATPKNFMQTWIRKIRDACIVVQLALIAGGGVAFFVIARLLFDRVHLFSEHPRFDAGEVVGPFVGMANFVHNVFGLTILMAALARGLEPTVYKKPNRWLAIVAFLILLISVAERFLLIPQMIELRQSIGRAGFDGDSLSPERKQFGMYHGIDSVVHIAIVALAWIGLFLDRAATRGDVR